MNFIDNGTYEVDYDNTNITRIDYNVNNMLLLIFKGDFGHIDADNNAVN